MKTKNNLKKKTNKTRRVVSEISNKYTQQRIETIFETRQPQYVGSH